MNPKLLLGLALVLSGCASSPRSHLTGAVYDGQSQGTNSYGLNGLGFPKLDLQQLDNPVFPPTTFHYRWEPPAPEPKTSAVLTRVATVWKFSAHSRGGGFTNHVESDYLVFDDHSTFHEEVSRRLEKEARAYFADWTCAGWDNKLDHEHWASSEAYLLCNTPNVVSVEFYSGAFPTHGGAEPGTPLNFINVNGHAREFTEAELFVPRSGWEKKLSDIVVSELPKVQNIPAGIVTGFEPEQLSEFTVTPMTLQIHIGNAEIPDAGGGELVVEIPWSDLRNYLQPDGPARFFIRMAKN